MPASSEMSDAFQTRYGVNAVALIACHDRRHSFRPPSRPHRPDELVVGIAGQFYANAEWQPSCRR